MAQKREKDETLELKVPSDTPLSLSCPDKNCNKTASTSFSVGPIGPILGPDTTRLDKPLEGPTPCAPILEEAVKYFHAEARTGPMEERKRTADSAASGGWEPVKRAVNRCFGCGKRVGLTGFRCRCGDLFCADHRYSDRHDCSYDYKAAGREAIARENPVVRAAKILKV